MPEPEKVDAPSQPCVTGTQERCYKSLLYQQALKLKKQLPVYQTNNEGSAHEPKFRTTVWVDGVSYTSPNTFNNRKLAEKDASKITLFAIMQKLKTEALHHVLEDKIFSKSILVEYAVRMNIQKPTYQTTKLESLIPLFRSSLVFNDESFSGDDCRSKKEAQQSAARAVILKYLDSETGNILSEIVKSKFNHIVTKDNTTNDTNGVNLKAEITKIPFTETNPIPSVDITQTHTQEIPSISVSAVVPPLMNPHVHVSQIPIQTPIQTIPMSTAPMNPPVQVTETHVPPISIQTQTQTISDPIQTPINTYSEPSVGNFPNFLAALHLNLVQRGTAQTVSMPTVIPQPLIQTPTQTVSIPTVISQTQTPIQTPTQNVLMPTVITQTPIQTPTPNVSIPTVIPQIPIQTPTSNVSIPSVIPQTQTPIQTSTTNVLMPTVMPQTQTSMSGTNNSPVNQSSSNVVEPIITEVGVPPVTVDSSLPITGKKRNRKNKKSAQKKMRSENQLAMSAIFQGQVPSFTAQ